MHTKMIKLSKQELLSGLNAIIKQSKIVALTNKEGKILYDYITNPNEIEFNYTPTVLSPKKFFFPAEEVILDYSTDGQVSANIQAEQTVLFGIRPCDVNGIKILNEAFGESKGDPNYLAKLEKSIIIAMDCDKLCDEKAFCYSVGSQNANSGYDIMLKPVHDQFALIPRSDKGLTFMYSFFKTEPANFIDRFLSSLNKNSAKNLVAKFEAIKAENFKELLPFKNLANFPEIFEQSKDHPVWEEEAKKCLSCGSCVSVCPTCYCFDVADELKLNLKEGQRLRRWDSCMLSSFATVAGGENFREEVAGRLRHRISRKFNYLMKKHGQSVCVGCGRCVRACLAEISPKKIAQKINSEII